MHDVATKARALALLMTGNTGVYVSRECGVDRHTLRRWRAEARAAGLWPDLSQVAGWASGIEAKGFTFRGVGAQRGPGRAGRVSEQNAHKKEKSRA